MQNPRHVLIKGTIVILASAIIAAGMLSLLSGLQTTQAQAVQNYDPYEMQIIEFEEDTDRFPNPERGWYRSYFSDDIWGLDHLKSQGISVIQLKADLSDFTEKEIDVDKLQEISFAMDLAREFGLKVIFRAAYDFSGKTAPEPEDLNLMLTHIKQLGDVFKKHSGVLWIVQAGFLGPWGEWHSSLYGDIPSFEVRKAVIEGLLEATPERTYIQVRRPSFIRDMSDVDLSRVGYHNDSLLSTENEYGTYTDPGFSREDELNWVEDNLSGIPFSGETCCLTEYSDPQNTIEELELLGANSINIDYEPSVIEKWKSSEYGDANTFKYVSDRLGYRFVIEQAQLNKYVPAGGDLRLVLDIRNNGFAKIGGNRELEIVLVNGRKEYTVVTETDPSVWDTDVSIRLDYRIEIPENMYTGSWDLYINIPDPDENLKDDQSYSVRFANSGVWYEDTGYNLIAEDITVYMD